MVLVLFLVTTMLGMLLISVALILGLSMLFGSFIYALIAVGAAYVIAALLLYYLSLKQSIANVNRQLDAVYEISTALAQAYNKLSHKNSGAQNALRTYILCKNTFSQSLLFAVGEECGIDGIVHHFFSLFLSHKKSVFKQSKFSR